MPTWLTKIRWWMGKIADFFIAGRNAGAWNKKPGAPGLDPKQTDFHDEFKH